MKKSIILLLVMILSAGFANAQQMDQAAMMKAWTDYMTPGSIHKMLAASNGTWNVETTLWMDPAAPPTTSKGTCTNKMVMGGRYQVSDFKSEMMGQPFEGQSTTAYDNAKKTFINTWIDNMGTGIMVLQGTWDEGTRSITYTGTEVDPMTGKDVPVREVYTIVDDKHHTMEMYIKSPEGKEYKNMAISFTKPH